MRAPAFWWREPGSASTLLRPFAALYGAVAGKRLEQPGGDAGVRVVCIGNPIVGGAGKTPTALAAARLLAEAGEFPAFLSRGYGGRMSGPVRVDPAAHGFEAVGDEPLLLARAFPTIVARDRLAGARLARAHGATVVVMDDGFQNPALAKDFSVLVIDGARGLGNGCVFPAGPLRAELDRQLRRTHGLVVIGEGLGVAAARKMAAQHRHPLFAGRLEPDGNAIEILRQRPVLAFAGIGDPEKFFATLRAAAIEAPVRRAFADHHAYTAGEAEELLRTADACGLVPVTTEKDFVRLAPHPALQARTRVVPVSLRLDDLESFAATMLGAIRKNA